MSEAEDAFAQELRWLKFPPPEREFRFAKSIGRQWRFDFAWPDHMVAVEIEGGVYIGGRHTRGEAFEKDTEKYNEAALLGWRVLRVTPRQVRDGWASNWVTRALNHDEVDGQDRRTG